MSSSTAPDVASSRMERPKTANEAEQLLKESGEHHFGTRLLKDNSEEAVWEHNAWDHVKPPPDYMEEIQAKLNAQALAPVEKEDAKMYHADPAGYWNQFYASHQEHFFKNRKWLASEFGELEDAAREGSGPRTVVEIGCGAGDTLLPLYRDSRNPELNLYGYDYSSEAVEVVRKSEVYKADHLGSCYADKWDLSATNRDDKTRPVLPPGLEEGSADVVVLIFVLSALHPDEWEAAARNVTALLKPGGKLLFRDYGRYDLPQLRFKKNRMLADNFYVRGDGTRVYFFEKAELLSIFKARPPENDPEEAASCPALEGPALYNTLQLAEDRRMLLNRKERKRMYRVWLQAKLVKL